MEKDKELLANKNDLRRALWDDLPIGILILDRDRVVYTNKKTQAFLGISHDYLKSKGEHSVFDFLDPERKKEFAIKYAEAFENSATDTVLEWPVLTAKGERKIIQTNFGPIEFGGNKCLQVVCVDVTNLHRAEETAKTSQQQLKQIIEAIEEVVYLVTVTDNNRKVEFISSNVEKLIGISADKYATSLDKLSSMMHPEDLPLVSETAKTLKIKNEPQVTTYRFMHQKTKEYRWLEERVYPRFDKDGKSIGVLGVTRDVTQRIEAENKIQHSEKKFRMLANNAQDVIYKYIFHPEPKYDYISPSIEEMSGYTPEEFYADPMLGYKIVHPEDFKDVSRSYEVIKQGKTFSKPKEQAIVLRWIRKDGIVVWTETRNRPIFNTEGRVIAMEGISRDITESKSAELRIMDSEKRYRELFENSVSGVFRTTEAGEILDCNESYLKIFGYTKEEMLSVRVQSFYYSPEDRPAYINELKKEGVVKNLQLRLRRKNGEAVYVLVNAMRKAGKTSSETIIEGTIFDITGYIHATRALQESERTLSTLMNNLPGMAYRCRYDKNWTMMFASNGCKELTGYNPEEIIENKSRPYASIVHPEDTGVGTLQIKQALRDKSSFEIEYRIIDASGRSKWVWERGEGVYSPEGEVLFLEGFIADITERKNFEIAQEESRKMYKNLIESSPEGLFVHDFSGNVLFANSRAVSIMGAKSQEDFVGSNVLSFSVKEDAHVLKKRKAPMLKGEDLAYQETRVKRLDGKIIEIETKPLLIDFQGKKAALVFFRDLTYHRQLEKEVVRAQVAEETNIRLEEEIKERKNTERILRETQKYARLLIDSSLDMICASDREGFMTEFNSAAQKTFGYKAEEVLGKHVGMLYADPEERQKITEKHLYKDGVFSGEVKNRKKSGEIFSAYLSASVLRNDKGDVIGAMGVSRDITELKKNEERIKQSEERYRAIYRQAFVGIALVDFEGKFLQVNQKLVEMFGYSEEEILKKNFLDITFKEDRDRGAREREQLVKGKLANYSTEKRYVAKDGSIIHTDLLVSLVRDVEGRPQYTVAVYEDITDRKEAELKILKQTSQLNAIINSSTHHILTIDKNYKLTSINKNQMEWIKTYYSIEPKLGMSMVSGKMLTSRDHNDIWLKHIDLALQGHSQQFEVPFETKSGNVIWREVYMNPIFGGKDEPMEVSVIAHDITDKKTNEERIKQSLKEKEVLLKEVHHRVKNNLQVITSILSLQSSYVKDANTLTMLRESQDRIKSMAFIHESLYQTKDFSNVNFSEYVVNLSKNLLRSYDLSGGGQVALETDVNTVQLNLDQSIPCGLIINELISNTLKYAFKKKGKGKIQLRIKEQDEKVTMIVADDGVGIAAKLNYRKTDSLGLQLVVTLVEQLNGTIKLERKNGTKFTITFPKIYKNRI